MLSFNNYMIRYNTFLSYHILRLNKTCNLQYALENLHIRYWHLLRGHF